MYDPQQHSSAPRSLPTIWLNNASAKRVGIPSCVDLDGDNMCATTHNQSVQQKQLKRISAYNHISYATVYSKVAIITISAEICPFIKWSPPGTI